MLIERYLGKNKLGTTKRGIGPAYADKAMRVGIRVQDLLDAKIFREKLDGGAGREEHRARQGLQPPAASTPTSSPSGSSPRSSPGSTPYVADTVSLVHEALDAGRARAVRGRPGHVPGPGPRHLPLRHLVQPRRRRGVRRRRGRARSTSTGSSASPRPTSPASAPGRSPPSCSTTTGDTLVDRGHEFGTNTGRRRRPGWFDAVMLRQAVRLNSLSRGRHHQARHPRHASRRSRCASPTTSTASATSTCRTTSPTCTRAEPDLRGAAGLEHRPDLGAPSATSCPPHAVAYLEFLQEQVGVPITFVGSGPGRDQFVHFDT